MGHNSQESGKCCAVCCHVKESKEHCELSDELMFGTGIYCKFGELKCYPNCGDLVTCLPITHKELKRYSLQIVYGF
jgi:hypothetical protein